MDFLAVVYYTRRLTRDLDVKISKELESGEAGVRKSGAADLRRVRLVLIGIGLATSVAFRAVLIAPFGLFEPTEFEYWFFIPGRDSGALSVLVASWLLWNRREQIASTWRGRFYWSQTGQATR